MPGKHPLTEETLQRIVKEAVHDVLGEAGLRVDGIEQTDLAREDFSFLRQLREGTNSTAAKIGWLVITALVGGAIFLLKQGLNFWNS